MNPINNDYWVLDPRISPFKKSQFFGYRFGTTFETLSGHFPVTPPTASGSFQDHPETAKHRSGPLETSSGPLWDHYFGTTFGPPRDSKTPLRTAQNQLGATSGPLRDNFGAASRPPDRKTPLRTSPNQLDTSSVPTSSAFWASKPQNTAQDR